MSSFIFASDFSTAAEFRGQEEYLRLGHNYKRQIFHRSAHSGGIKFYPSQDRPGMKHFSSGNSRGGDIRISNPKLKISIFFAMPFLFMDSFY